MKSVLRNQVLAKRNALPLSFIEQASTTIINHLSNLTEIKQRFAAIFPENDYGDLAERIGEYWIAMLEKVWRDKDPIVKQKDLAYLPADPLSRIEQKTMVIAYADSIQQVGVTTLTTLEEFLSRFFRRSGVSTCFPAVRWRRIASTTATSPRWYATVCMKRSERMISFPCL